MSNPQSRSGPANTAVFGTQCVLDQVIFLQFKRIELTFRRRSTALVSSGCGRFAPRAGTQPGGIKRQPRRIFGRPEQGAFEKVAQFTDVSGEMIPAKPLHIARFEERLFAPGTFCTIGPGNFE